jgi:hypothetical protein
MIFKMMKDKINRHAAIGEGVLMIYRLFLVAIIAIIILGVSAIYYDYYIDVRNVEARILTKQVANCLAPEGVVDLKKLSSQEANILDYCGIKNTERFYVRVNIFENSKQVILLQQGDSGAKWVRQIFENRKLTQNIEKYEPGYFNWTYTVNLLKEGKSIKSEMYVEALVSHEF